MSAALGLRPLRPDEYDAWRRTVTDGYAADIEASGDTPRDAARTKAEQDMATVLAEGLATAGHAVFVVERDAEPVGRLWVAERAIDGRRVLYVYDVEIDEGHRGEGLGRAAMLLAEDEARARGIGRIELNVFGGNSVARSLYRSLGYTERAVSMGKDLGDPRPPR
ncbi:MAG: N-acetyltransferase family protein [Candidatus Limnocylindria bacterium]